MSMGGAVGQVPAGEIFGNEHITLYSLDFDTEKEKHRDKLRWRRYWLYQNAYYGKSQRRLYR